MKLQNQILISLIAVSLIPVIISSTLSFKIAENQILKLRIASLKDINEDKFSKIEQYLDLTNDIAYRLKNNETILSSYDNLLLGIKDKANDQYRATKNKLDKLLQPIQHNNNLNDIFILNNAGQILYASNPGSAWKYSEKSIDQLVGIQLIKDPNKIYYSPVFVDKLKGYAFSFLNVSPILLNNNNFIYLAIEDNMDYLYKILGNTRGLGNTGESILETNVNGLNIILSPIRSARNIILKQVTSNKIESKNDDVFTGLDYREREVIGVFAKFPETNWEIITKMDKEEIYSNIDKLRYIAFLTSLIICIGAIIIAIYLSRIIINPLKRLKNAVERMHEKEFDVAFDQTEIETFPDEIRTLTSKFSDMAMTIKKYIKDIKIARNQAIKALEELKRTQTQLVESEKMSSIGVLTAGIAHEINNPINFISTSIDPLKKDINDILAILNKYSEITPDSSNVPQQLQKIEDEKKEIDLDYTFNEVNELLESIHNGVHRTSEIVKALRVFSRLDEAALKKANINENIDSTLVLLIYEYKKQITITKDYGQLPEIDCRPGKINQVLMNIIVNAIQAIKEQGEEKKGEIKITTRQVDDHVQIRIQDNGPGIKTEYINKIFDPFFTTKQVGAGTGLGLSISYSIIQEHHGNIEVKSEEGKGTEFIITLPITQK